MFKNHGFQGQGPFKIKKLFRANDSGFQNDLTSLSTVFTTNSGNTAVSAPGDSVGRIDNLISSGTPDLTQATAGSRPTWARIPRGGRRNRFVQNTNQISGTGWVDLSALQTFTTNSTDIVDPWGTNKATKVVFGGTSPLTARQVVTNPVGSNTASIYVYVPSGQGITGWRFNSDYQDTEGGGNFDSTTFDTWVRASSSATLVASRTYCDLNFSNSSGTNFSSGKIAYIVGAMTEAASSATTYQDVTSNFDITESGVPSIWIPYFDGGDYLTTGVQQFSAAGDLFADSASRWTIACVFSAFSAQGTLIAKAGSGAESARTFQWRLNPGTGGYRITARGTVNTTATSLIDGQLRQAICVWDGTTLTLYQDSTGSGTTLSVGSAAEESEIILIGAKSSSSPDDQFLGYIAPPIVIDRALTASERAQLMAWMRNYYGTP